MRINKMTAIMLGCALAVIGFAAGKNLAAAIAPHSEDGYTGHVAIVTRGVELGVLIAPTGLDLSEWNYKLEREQESTRSIAPAGALIIWDASK